MTPKRKRLDWRNDEDPVGAAERELGRYVYRIVETLMSAAPATPEGQELAYLSRLIVDVEEYGTEQLTGSEIAADIERWRRPIRDRKLPADGKDPQ